MFMDMLLVLALQPDMQRVPADCGLYKQQRCAGCRYEDYLDNQITATDVYYLEDVELARHLVELG